MKAVYIAESGEYEQRAIDGIYSTRKRAIEAFPESEITIYSLNDCDISSIPRWWRVSFDPPKEWSAINWDNVGIVDTSPQWLQWDLPHSKVGWEPVDGRVGITVRASSERQAISKAKLQLKGQTVPISTYSVNRYPQPWKKTGEGIPYP